MSNFYRVLIKENTAKKKGSKEDWQWHSFIPGKGAKRLVAGLLEYGSLFSG
jgi:hypothetical protein